MKNNSLIILVILLLLHFFLLFNLRFEAWPSMILHPWLMNKGFLFYQDIIEPYLPLLPWTLLLFFKSFGFTLLNLKIFTWFLILLIDFLVFFLSLKFWKKEAVAFLSLVFYIFWQAYLDGNGLWFDLFTTPFLLLSFYFFWKFSLKEVRERNLFLSGVFMGLAFFTKQTTLWFYLLLFSYLALQKNESFSRKIFEAILLCLPLLTFLIFAVFYFSSQKILTYFLFWTLKFPFWGLSRTAAHKAWPNLRELILTLVPFLSLIFFPMVKTPKKSLIHRLQGEFPQSPHWGMSRRSSNGRVAQPRMKNPPASLPCRQAGVLGDSSRRYAFLFPWFLTAGFFILPRWGLFHLQPALAFFSLFAGQILFSLTQKKLKKISLLILLGVIFLSLFFQIRFLKQCWQKETRFFESKILKQALWLRENTKREEVVFNLNGPDQLYFLANRLPLKPWVINFSWFYETGDLKKRVLENLKETPPGIIIYNKPLEGKALTPGVYQPEEIKEWIMENYWPCFKIEETEFLKKTRLLPM